MKILAIVFGFGFPAVALRLYAERVVDLPLPALMFAIPFAVLGYAGLLSVLLNTTVTSVYQAQKKLTGFRQTLVNVGLLALLAFTAMVIVLSYMKHFGIKD